MQIIKFFLAATSVLAFAATAADFNAGNASREEVAQEVSRLNRVAEYYEAKASAAKAKRKYQEAAGEITPISTLPIPSMPIPPDSTSISFHDDSGSDLGSGGQTLVYLKSYWGKGQDVQGEIVWGEGIIPVKPGALLPRGWRVISIDSGVVLAERGKQKIRITQAATAEPK